MDIKQSVAALGLGVVIGAGGVVASQPGAGAAPVTALANVRLTKTQLEDGGVAWFGDACGETPRGDGTSETSCWPVQVNAPLSSLETMLLQQR